jgi:hypothetical protein
MSTVDPHVAYINFLETKEKVQGAIQAAFKRIVAMKQRGEKPTHDDILNVKNIVRAGEEIMKHAIDTYQKEMQGHGDIK